MLFLRLRLLPVGQYEDEVKTMTRLHALLLQRLHGERFYDASLSLSHVVV